MLLTDVNSSIDSNCLTSVSIQKTENIKRDYNFPDPNIYYILSEAGKINPFIGERTVLLNESRAYLIPSFSVNSKTEMVAKIANTMFGNTQPLEGDSLKALRYCLNNSGKLYSTKNNRL